MPQIIVQADTPDGRLGAVTLAERLATPDMRDQHYIAQLIERTSWALIHAEWHESLSNVLDPEGADRPRLTSGGHVLGGAVSRSAGVADGGWVRPRVEMSFDLLETVRAALDDGCSLAELQAAFLARAESDDEIAAAWVYAWSYDAIRPPRDDLAARITNRAVRDHAQEAGVISAAVIDRPADRMPDAAPHAPRSRPRAADPAPIATVQSVIGARQVERCAGLPRVTNRVGR